MNPNEKISSDVREGFALLTVFLLWCGFSLIAMGFLRMLMDRVGEIHILVKAGM